MYKLNNQELLTITGGFSITGSIINAFVTAGKFIFDAGRSLGSSIRRINGNKLCSLR